MQQFEGWKTILALVYGLICLFDFIIVPSWIGINRQSTNLSANIELIRSLDPIAQMELIENWTYTHSPFTLRGNGLFHLAFGALLTGSAVTRFTKAAPTSTPTPPKTLDK